MVSMAIRFMEDSNMSQTRYIDNNNNLYGCGTNSSGNQGSGDTTNVLTFTKRDL